MNRFAKMFLFSVVAIAAFGLIATDDADAGCYGGFGYGGYGGYGGWCATPYYNTTFYPSWGCYTPYYGYRTCNYGGFNYGGGYGYGYGGW